MEVVKIKERKDGSADVIIEMSKKEENKLIEFAILTIIRDGMKRIRKNEKMVNRSK